MPYLEVIHSAERDLDPVAVERFRRQVLEIFQEVCEVRADQVRMAILDVPFENTMEPLRAELDR